MSATPVRTSSSQDNPAPVRYRRTLKDRIADNLPQKLIALVCSLILFVIVLSDRSMMLQFEKIPIEMAVPEGYVMLEDRLQTVDVTLQGRASILRGLKRDDIGTIRLQLSPREGNTQVTLQPAMISLPEGVRIEKFKPEFIGINLEMLESRAVAVTTDHAFSGELLHGYQLGEIKIQPDTVQISGPRSVILETSQLYIDPIDLTGKASTFTINRGIVVRRTGAQGTPEWVMLSRAGIHANAEQVNVTVSVISKSKSQVVLGVPIKPLNLSSEHEFVPSTIDLTLVGSEEALAKVDSKILFVTVDAASEDGKNNQTLFTGDDFSVQNLPDGVSFDRSRLPSVLLKVWDSRGRTDTDRAGHKGAAAVPAAKTPDAE
ncbi:MAG: YbbR-like domain-containing protein [Proteobacteria bacterium]|nr:YbbR-like domain-containing protein [Pseudomonadota bacterium]